MKTRAACCILIAASVASCAKLGVGKPVPVKQEPSPFGSTGIPPQMRARTEDPGTPVVPGGNAQGQTGPIQITPEQDIVFTDPDNPDAVIPELSDILASQPKRRGPWEQSETIARKRAGREGKPLLIWFTDSRSSPMCKAINQELFSMPDFESWATEHLVRLKVDANEQVKDPDISLDEKETKRVDIRTYVTRLKKQYKVLGQPTLILVHPDGSVIGRYRGYQRGQADFTWGLIKQGEAMFQNSYQKWRAGLEKKGYREWADRSGRKVFARLANYSNGTLILIEPDGTRCKTHENKLSDSDRDWIAEQKKLRGL